MRARNGDITTMTLEPRGLSKRASAAIGRHWNIIYFFIYLIQYLSRGIQFSRASLNGALTQHKTKHKTLKQTNKQKNIKTLKH